MITPTRERERRDWALLIFIIPIGIILMLIAGQIAVRLVPEWSVNAGMQSNLNPNVLPNEQGAPIQPLLPAILTPLDWIDTYLTPGAGSGGQVLLPPFIVFEPSAAPVATKPPPTAATQPSPTAPTATVPTGTAPTVIVSPPSTGTKPPVDPPPTQPTATQPTATQPTATQPTGTPPPTDTPTPTGTPSTPPPLYVEITPVPTELGIDTPPDGTPADITPGSYVIISLPTPVRVSATPDANYDLIFYEAIYSYTNGSGDQVGSVLLDQIIIGISQTDDGSYYEVFNWGDDNPDTNTNVNYNNNNLPLDTTDCTQPECDNREIPVAVNSTPVSPPILYTAPGTDIGTGILIDVDNASGRPPEGDYGYVVIISPVSGVPDEAQVDSVVVEEVPIVPP